MTRKGDFEGLIKGEDDTDSNDRKEDRSLDGFSLNSERSLFVMFHWC